MVENEEVKKEETIVEDNEAVVVGDKIELGAGKENGEAGKKDEVKIFKCVEGTYKQASKQEIEEVGYKKESEMGEKECEYCFEMIQKMATRCKHCYCHLTHKSKEDGDKFIIVREEAHEEYRGFKEVLKKVHIILKDSEIIQLLKSYLPDFKELQEKEPKLSVTELLPTLPTLRQCLVSYGKPEDCPLFPVANFLEKEVEEQEHKFKELKAKELVVYEMLSYLFQRSSQFFTTVDTKYIVGSTVGETKYVRSAMGNYFSLSAEVIKSNGDQFFITTQSFYIPQFAGVKGIEELNIQPMNPEIFRRLKARGQKFNEGGTGNHYYDYKGPMLYATKYYKMQWKADGRVMVDGTSFNKMNPTYDQFVQSSATDPYSGASTKNKNLIKQIPEDQWFKCWHTLGGFSFRTKKWGELLVENLLPIVFDPLSFSRLVLPTEKKQLIESLITNSKSSFSDIIGGKGAGCIFLLHGPPGTGKTLTAEAVAELLQRPLYSISVGELGVAIAHLESSLRDILDVASVWDAVILIDEADIFLEKRCDNDIKRNALVGVFLRLLEYHQGILFLTTNRVQNFDEAFHSRISVALKYPVLNEESRDKVWRNLLEAAGELQNPRIDIAALAQSPLNGRQIRTTIRLAQSLAVSCNEDLCSEHFERCISIATQFQSDLLK